MLSPDLSGRNIWPSHGRFFAALRLVPSEVEGVEGTVTRDRSVKYPGKMTTAEKIVVYKQKKNG